MLQSLQGNNGMGSWHSCAQLWLCVQGTGCDCTGSPLPVLEALLLQPKGAQQKGLGRGFGFSSCSPSCRFEPKQGCSFLGRRRMPKQRSRAKGRGRTNRYMLALVGRKLQGRLEKNQQKPREDAA